MAGWISSRLKAAEQLLQQIDQQAAGSLRKQERQVVEAPTRSTIDEHGSRDGLKNHNTSLLQTPKKERHEVLSGGKARQSEMLLQAQGPPGSRRNIPGSGSTKPALVTQDWTELLGSGELVPPAASSSVARSSSSVGSSSEHTATAVHPTLKAAAGQRSSQNTGKAGMHVQGNNESPPTSNTAAEGSGEHEPREQELMDVAHHEHDVRSLQTMIENAIRIKVGSRELNAPGQAGEAIGEVFAEEPPPVHDEEGKDNGSAAILAADHALETAEFDKKLTLLRKDADLTTFTDSVGQTEATPREELHQGLVKNDFAVKQEVAEEERGNSEQREEALGATPAALEITNLSSEIVWENTNQEDFDEDIGEGSTISSSEEESERSGSDSESDSEYEERVRRRRERRRDIAMRRAAKAAAAEAARAAIRDREDLVAKLEKEKEALEHMLAEKEEEQVKDAVELRRSIKEVLHEVEIEKHRHTLTRREGLAREAHLEAKNAELTKALAAAERNLEDEVLYASGIHNKVNLKIASCSDLERKISSIRSCLRQPLLPAAELSLYDKNEQKDAKTEKIELGTRLEDYQRKAKELEEKIAIASEAHYTPSVMELELQTRLNQLTDHLIQKQAQVEALSTEKATLHFRLEAVSNTLREAKSAAQSRASKRNKANSGGGDWSMYDDDIEYGLSRPYSSKDKGFVQADFDHPITQGTGSHPVMQLVLQMDSLFLGGARILRTHSSARALAGLYLFALHGWVLFVLYMHARAGKESNPALLMQMGVNSLRNLTADPNATSGIRD
ncbi:hypothetical protein CY35_10G098500 [Sphagnum magellanicum]|nr:hypothetical protein CY35_10G098500 [Sphagnum magellanicum]